MSINCAFVAKRQAQARIVGSHNVTCPRMLPPRGKDSSPLALQYSAAVTHCTLAASHFAYFQREGRPRQTPPAPPVEPVPSRTRRGNRNHLATLTDSKKVENVKKTNKLGQRSFYLARVTRDQVWLTSTIMSKRI